MSDRKNPLFIFLNLTMSVLVFLVLLFVQVARPASFTNERTLAGMHGPGGGGGWGGGGGGGGGQLTQAEIDGLTYMREEEKLARDSYWTLYAKWGLPIFSNIASSEVMHMSRIKELLDRYGLADPAASKPVGVFANPVLQQFYDDLMAQGGRSSREALQVGVAIEEVDIRDLQTYLAQTNRSDIINIYTNLRNASYNHLHAFLSQPGQ